MQQFFVSATENLALILVYTECESEASRKYDPSLFSSCYHPREASKSLWNKFHVPRKLQLATDFNNRRNENIFNDADSNFTFFLANLFSKSLCEPFRLFVPFSARVVWRHHVCTNREGGHIMPFNNISSCMALVWRELDLPQLLRLRIKSALLYICLPLLPEFFLFRKSENIQIMYFNVFFSFAGACIHKMCCTCRTRREIHGKCLARKRCARPLPAHLSTIFIIKVNDFFSGCLSSRWCDTHIWFKIDVVTRCRTWGYGKYFPFDPFYYFEMFFSLVAKLPTKISALVNICKLAQHQNSKS